MKMHKKKKKKKMASQDHLKLIVGEMLPRHKLKSLYFDIEETE